MNPNTLLADPKSLEVEKFVSEENSITIVVHSILPTVSCPNCHQLSGSLKTRYFRQVADLPWHGVKIKLLLKVRKFRCRNDLCFRKVFCERLPKVVAKYARRTVRLDEVIVLLAFVLGGRSGAKATAKLNVSVSKDTLLRTIRRHSKPSLTNIKVLGVDDFAFRKGSNYGTILVDLEERKPIDLLPDRQAETLKNWLLLHPKIETVTRDRSINYAEAVSNGLPKAEQVADRWHLLKNLSEMVEKILIGKQSSIKQAFQVVFQPEKIPNEVKTEESKMISEPKSDSLSEVRRREIYKNIKELFSQGTSIRKIAEILKLNRNTVKKYLRSVDFPSRQTGQGSKSKLQKYAKYVQKRWQEGEQNAKLLFAEIQERGYRGSISSVRKFVQKWRNASGNLINSIIPKCYSARQTTKMLLMKSEEPKELNFIDKLCEISPEIAELQKLGIEFRTMIREKRVELFDEWLKKIESGEIPALKNWVNNLLLDEKAVRSAMTSDWSNGQTEGQVNRLKTIKRQMYGRANFDLLKARVLYQN
jgi:transposase